MSLHVSLKFRDTCSDRFEHLESKCSNLLLIRIKTIINIIIFQCLLNVYLYEYNLESMKQRRTKWQSKIMENIIEIIAFKIKLEKLFVISSYFH